MTQTIKLTTTVKINGIPTISLSKAVSVEATDSIRITAGGTNAADPLSPAVDMEVEIQPSNTAGQVTFLAITSDRYDANLTYTVNADSTSSTSIELDQPQVLLGRGAVGLLDLDSAPQRLFFTNKLAEDAAIQILVGRDATPPPSS